jgi:hypothetical protein
MFANMLKNVSTTGAGASIPSEMRVKTYQASGLTTSGTGSVTVAVQGQNDPDGSWDTIGTISLALGVTRVSDGFTSDDRYVYIRGNVTGLSGTGAAVTLVMGA